MQSAKRVALVSTTGCFHDHLTNKLTDFMAYLFERVEIVLSRARADAGGHVPAALKMLR